MTNCPNCGAPVQGAVCEYCGTRFTLQPTDELISAGITPQEFIWTLYGEPIEHPTREQLMDDRIYFI